MELDKNQSLDKNQADELENKTESEKRFDRGTELDFFDVTDRDKRADETLNTNDVATNDGSVVETLDTAFHDVPGFNSHDDNISGSNRTDYYEARSNSKSDTEEELEARQRASEGEAGA
jgi:hypothetical protein